MKKSDMRRAVKERWRVKDDFGATGIVIAAGMTEDRILVLWDNEINSSGVHYIRAERIDDNDPH